MAFIRKEINLLISHIEDESSILHWNELYDYRYISLNVDLSNNKNVVLHEISIPFFGLGTLKAALQGIHIKPRKIVLNFFEKQSLYRCFRRQYKRALHNMANKAKNEVTEMLKDGLKHQVQREFNQKAEKLINK